MVKKVLIIIAIILVALFLTKDFLISALITNGIGAFTDLSASIKSIKVDLFKSVVDVKGLKIYNPHTFKDRRMVDMPDFYVAYDLGSFLSGTKHIKLMKINLAEFDVVKNEGGLLNLDSLKAIKVPAGGSAGAEKEQTKFRIDVLELKIGKAVYKDYSRGGSTVIKEFNVNLNERYENITNPYALASLIVFKALVNTGISSLTNFDLGPLKNMASDVIANATKIATEAAQDAVTKTTEGIKQLWPIKK